MTTAAQTAKAIRTELKSTFPNVKFSVTSESFSMGNAVRISWTDGPKSSDVDSVTNKFCYGHFDGMNDMYEISNSIEGLPQVKFVTTSRDMSSPVMDAIAKELGIENNNDYNSQRGDSNGCLIRREHSQRTF